MSAGMKGLEERLRDRFDGDHERGCEGRNYSCTCGYSDGMDSLCGEAADRIATLEAEVVRLRGGDFMDRAAVR